MPISDQDRIERDMAAPRVRILWQALQPLKTVISFMQSGAHPDDETSGLLAALAFRDGISLSYVCSTRGEGGQNDIGREAGADLGILRTREMEAAAARLDMRLYWMSDSAEDPLHDFGFSKSRAETLDNWGSEHTLARFVRAVRMERPDILCPTFLDVPGQHGHHRAMTHMAHQVIEAAADPGFDGCTQPAWQVRKLYLPAWGGGGQAYDDTEPPPVATLTISGAGSDPITGWEWERIGQQSRLCHRTQGMGRWVPQGETRDWPLHLARSAVPGPDRNLFAGLPRGLADLAVDTNSAHAEHLVEAEGACHSALSLFPDRDGILAAACRALKAVRIAIATCPDRHRDETVHRLRRKLRELSRVITLCACDVPRGRLTTPWLRPGQSTEFTLETRDRDGITHALDLPTGWSVADGRLTLASCVAADTPYRTLFDPAAPPAPALVTTVNIHGTTSETRHALETPPTVLQAASATLDPAQGFLNTALPERNVVLRLRDVTPDGAAPGLDLPASWSADRTGDGFEVHLPQQVEDGLYRIGLTLDGTAAVTERRIEHPHIAPIARSFAAEVSLRCLPVCLPDVRVAILSAGNERVGHWLAEMGVDVTPLSAAEIGDGTGLSAFQTIVIGNFALRFLPGLADAMPALHRWVAAGGTLITLYHRPWDNWEPDTTPPRRLEIGQPSLRWRVTDQTAEVTHLAPDHPLLTTPNLIGPGDWDGWHKERGLYFAKSWDDAYTPLLSMADPNEAPHKGALLAARFGRGQHIHTGLTLHHQMAMLVPGAFRLMANLIAAPA